MFLAGINERTRMWTLSVLFSLNAAVAPAFSEEAKLQGGNTGVLIRLSDLPKNSGGLYSTQDLEKAEIRQWLSQVQYLIMNSFEFKKLKEDVQSSKSPFYKSNFAFCIDGKGKAVGFHALSHSQTEIEDKLHQVLEKISFPPCPNHLHWSNGGMRVEMSVKRDCTISVSPEWPNTRLVSAIGAGSSL